jgi:hypothetical protein
MSPANHDSDPKRGLEGLVIFSEDLGPLPPGVKPPPRIPFRPLPPLTEEDLAAYREGRVVDVYVLLDGPGEPKVLTDPPTTTPPASGQPRPTEPPTNPS